MAEVKTPVVIARVVDGLFDGTAPAGAIKYQKSVGRPPAGFHFLCPCGCNVVGRVSFRRDSWTWNGDLQSPTVEPSILLSTGDGPHWHGVLVDGEWRPI